MKRLQFIFFLFIIAGCTTSQNTNTINTDVVNLITPDPVHFNAALVQKRKVKLQWIEVNGKNQTATLYHPGNPVKIINNNIT